MSVDPTHPLPGSALHPGGWLEIGVAAASENLATVRKIDVREPSEFNAELGHIAGAELVPLSTVENAARGWDRDKPILLICRSGGRSGGASRALRDLGFKTVYNMTGGMLAWNGQRLPVERA